ncbi:hypothetical protein E3983_11360 [Legionella israelensis]|uniref:Uncharacterized protein n=1 Tax=Legionella israelensis TaxID=454 RepID=A0AAX1EI82_9GAMM|nr:hypothetical protein [Legionella israelensis]QBR84896.1 hypothetical protein E3983_11360 [Legionella israelensis]
MLSPQEEAELKKRDILFEKKLAEACTLILSGLSKINSAIDLSIINMSERYYRTSGLSMSKNSFLTMHHSNFYRELFSQKLSILRNVLMQNEYLSDSIIRCIKEMNPYLNEEVIGQCFSESLAVVYLVIFSSPECKDILEQTDKNQIDEELNEMVEAAMGGKDAYKMYYEILIKHHDLKLLFESTAKQRKGA